MGSTLDSASRLPFEARCQLVLDTLGPDIVAVHCSLTRDSPAIAAAASVERVVWAIAANITGELLPTIDDGRFRQRTYLGEFPKYSWDEFKAALVRVRPSDKGPGCSGLRALACGVACEQRDDWQPPSARPVDSDKAGAAFQELQALHNASVVRFVAANFGERAGDPAEIAHDAWTRVFQHHWSRADSYKRFLGLSSISTLVIGYAEVGSLRALDRKQRERSLFEAHRETESGEEQVDKVVAGGANAFESLARLDFTTDLKDCVGRLTPQQRLFAHMILFLGFNNADAARKFGVTDQNVNYHLRQAAPKVGDCMRRKGHSRPVELG